MAATWWCSPSSDDRVVPATGTGPDPAATIELLAREGFELGPAEPATRTLLDSFDGRLHAAGARLESRPVYLPGAAAAVELHPSGSGMPTRPIVLDRMPSVPDDVPAGQLRDRLADLLGPRALGVRMMLTSNCRHGLRRNGDGATSARLELHTEAEISTQLHTTGRPPATTSDRHLWCLQVDQLSGGAKAASRWRRTLEASGLIVGDGDALDWAARVARVELAGFDAGARVRLRRDTPADEAVRAVLHRLGDAVSATWQGAADDIDPEFLHDLRTSLRRARTVLKVARHVLPETARLDALELADSLASLTGTARDLDVHLMEWDDFVHELAPADRLALGPVHDVLRVRRAAAHDSLSAALETIGRDDWVTHWRTAVDSPATLASARPRDARRRAGKVVADRLERAHRRVLRDGRRLRPSTPAEAYHELRKDAKRLRAVVDGFGSLVRAAHRRPYLARVKDLQDHLGRLQDASVQLAEIQGFLVELHEAPPATQHALASLAASLEARHDDLIAGFGEVFARFDRKATERALERVLDDLRR